MGEIEFSDQFLQNEALDFTTFTPFKLYKNSVYHFRANISYWLNDYQWA